VGIHTKKHLPIEGGDAAKRKTVSQTVAQDPTPLVKFYWAPSQETMDTVPLEYVVPDEFPIKGKPVKILRVVRLYYDGKDKPTPEHCHQPSWNLEGVSGPFIADAGYPRTVTGPEGLNGQADNGVTYQYLIDNGDIRVVGSDTDPEHPSGFTPGSGDCQASECWYGDLGLIDGSAIEAASMLNLDDLTALYTGSEECLALAADPNPDDEHGVSTDPDLVRMGGEYVGDGKIALIGINFSPPGATFGNADGGGPSGSTAGDLWKQAFQELKADLEATYDNLYVTVVNGKEDRFLELFTPAIDETDFVGFNVLHIAVEFFRSTYSDLSGAFVDYSNALQTNYEFFAGLRTIVYNDIGDPGDSSDDIATFEEFLTAAAGALFNFGFEYGGEVDYHSPDTSEFRSLIVEHFKLDQDPPRRS
jgi:hypothetical protein